MTPVTFSKRTRDFNPHALLATIDVGRKAMLFPKKQNIFAQGDPADADFIFRRAR
jgi:hypothetical protein